MYDEVKNIVLMDPKILSKQEKSIDRIVNALQLVGQRGNVTFAPQRMSKAMLIHHRMISLRAACCARRPCRAAHLAGNNLS